MHTVSPKTNNTSAKWNIQASEKLQMCLIYYPEHQKAR